MAEKHSEGNTNNINALKEVSASFEKHWKARAWKARKISAKEDAELNKAIHEEIELMDYINSQPEGTEYILGRHIDDFIIMNITSNLVVKNSIRYNVSDRLTRDLVIRNNVNECSVTYNQHLENIALINRYQKKDSTQDTCSLASLRGDVSLADVIDKAAKIEVGKDKKLSVMVKYNSTTYIPVIIDSTVVDNLFKSSYFNAELEEIMEDHFVNVQL
jgi:hypothetical protein